MSFLIGLTGGIGSGKTTVANLFAEHGASIVDTDAIAHSLTRPGGEAIALIRDAFGESCITADGALDRPYMRQLIFSDAAAKQRLEAILHPMIREHMLAQAHAAVSPYSLLVIPLLFEAGNYLGVVQRVLVIDSDDAIRIERTMQRSKLSEQEVRTIMAQQISREERLQRADDIILNNDGMDELRQQVLQLHQQYTALSAGKG